MPVLTCAIAKLQLQCRTLDGSSVSGALLEVEQLPDAALACLEMSDLMWSCGSMSKYFFFFGEMFYVDFEISKAPSVIQNIILLPLVFVIIYSILCFISGLWITLQNKKYFYFTKWEGNWGRSRKLTHHTLRLTDFKTETPVRLHSSSTTATGIAWVPWSLPSE